MANWKQHYASSLITKGAAFVFRTKNPNARTGISGRANRNESASTSAPDEFLTWFRKRAKWKTRRRVNRKIVRPRYQKFANQA